MNPYVKPASGSSSRSSGSSGSSGSTSKMVLIAVAVVCVLGACGLMAWFCLSSSSPTSDDVSFKEVETTDTGTLVFGTYTYFIVGSQGSPIHINFEIFIRNTGTAVVPQRSSQLQMTIADGSTQVVSSLDTISVELPVGQTRYDYSPSSSIPSQYYDKVLRFKMHIDYGGSITSRRVFDLKMEPTQF